MIPELGSISLSGALLVSAVAMLASVAAARFQSPRWMRAARWSIAGVFFLMTFASVLLGFAFLKDMFALDYVARYSERAMPVGYKLAAFWAGQEGSLLLWALLLSGMCVIAVYGMRKQTGADHAIALAVMAVVNGLFCVLLVFAADPFALIQAANVPMDGNGLNPMLQDPSMIAHPPLLFIGYAGYTIPFAVMVGVLVAGRSDNHWLALIRRWVLVSWLFLTAGIVLGAWWAYVELGWGGYWAWDPVENASLLPWLTSTALLHSIIVQQHRGMFKIWNVSLIAMSFILCIFGTYLTRSGVIQSVHAFGGDVLGTIFLIFLIICTLFCTGLVVWRRKRLTSEHELEGLISREGAFLLSNVLFTIMMLTTLVGTTFPLISGVFGVEPITVGQSFYNKIVAPMALVIVALMATGPVLAFGRSAALKIAKALTIPAIITAILTVIVGFVVTANIWALLCTAICCLGTFAVIVDFLRSTSARRRSTGEYFLIAAMRLIDKDHRRYGGQLTHLGMMLLVIGIAGSSLFDVEQTHRLRAGESVAIDGHSLTFVEIAEVRDVNFTAVQATVALTDRSGVTYTLRPQRRYYDTWKDQPNSEVSILTTWREDVFVSLAGWDQNGVITAIQVKINPLVIWIWIGGIVMVLGSTFCTLPRLLPQPRTVTARHPATVREAEGSPTGEPVVSTTSMKMEASS